MNIDLHILLAFTIVKPSTFTVEHALVEVDWQGMFCFTDLAQSPAMVHSMLFTAQAFRDVMLRMPIGEVAQVHLSQSLHYLQQSLNDTDFATSTTTMAVVTSLATTAAFFGEFDTAKKHMDGLYQMVNLRGGLGAFGSGSMVAYKAQRYIPFL